MNASSSPQRTPAQEAPVRPRKVRAVALGVVVVLVALAFWRYFSVPADGPAELLLQGNIDVRQVNLAFKVAGRIEKLAVDEGDAVKTGQVIGSLELKYFEDDLRLATAAREEAAANLDRLKNGSRPEEIEVARAQETEQRTVLQRAEQEFRRAERLATQKALSAQEFEQIEAVFREAQARLNSVAASRRLTEIGPRVEDISAGRAKLEAEKARVIISGRNLADARLIAPNDGTILTRARETGAIVQPGETIFALTLASPVWVRTYVGEPDLGSVQPGMTAAVVTDTAPQHPYTARVGFISPTAEFTPKTVETRELRTDLVYRLRVVVDDPDGGLRQGMPVTVRLQLTEPRRRTFWQRLTEAFFLDRLGLGSSGR